MIFREEEIKFSVLSFLLEKNLSWFLKWTKHFKSRSLFTYFFKHKPISSNTMHWGMLLKLFGGNSTIIFKFINHPYQEHCALPPAVQCSSAHWFQITQNSPKIRFRNSWNCLIILVKASFWQIIGLKGMLSPETEIYVIKSAASWFRNREIK